MSRTKDYLMKLSEEMGFDGEINDEVLLEASLRLPVSKSSDAEEGPCNCGRENCPYNIGPVLEKKPNN